MHRTLVLLASAACLFSTNVQGGSAPPQLLGKSLVADWGEIADMVVTGGPHRNNGYTLTLRVYISRAGRYFSELDRMCVACRKWPIGTRAAGSGRCAVVEREAQRCAFRGWITHRGYRDIESQRPPHHLSLCQRLRYLHGELD
jgi:hypothetical protein